MIQWSDPGGKSDEQLDQAIRPEAELLQVRLPQVQILTERASDLVVGTAQEASHAGND